MYVIMISMVLCLLVSLLHFYGVLNESRTALTFAMVAYVLIMILELSGAIAICIYGVEESEILTNDLNDVFFKLIYRMDHDERANRILKIVQEYVS